MSFLPVTLAIDTAAPRLQLALLRADGGVDFSVDDIATGHAEILFPRLETLLERNGLGHADLRRIAVTTGPGSFTGLRIGLSAARGLGLARGLPVLGIPSLLALSLGASVGPVAVLLDARRGEAYFQSFSNPGVALTPPQLLPIEEARGLVPGDATLIESPFVPIEAMVRYAAEADPVLYPPHAAYIRDADAKPQNAARIPRRV
jgi:tRNA threonylcarbamoyladenosine biosynthesis protein TsaB